MLIGDAESWWHNILEVRYSDEMLGGDAFE